MTETPSYERIRQYGLLEEKLSLATPWRQTKEYMEPSYQLDATAILSLVLTIIRSLVGPQGQYGHLAVDKITSSLCRESNHKLSAYLLYQLNYSGSNKQ